MMKRGRQPIDILPGTKMAKLEVLDHRHLAFIAGVVSGKSYPKAAREAGFSKAYSNKASITLMRNQMVLDELERQREKIQKAHNYDVEMAMRECNEALLFARETKNANALTKTVELKAKLMGLLIDKIDQRNVGGFEIRIGGIDEDSVIEGEKLDS